MTAAHVDDCLLALVERRLAPAERARVLTHLAGCARCRAAAAELDEAAGDMRALAGTLRALPTQAARQWPAVWARVQGANVAGRLGPQARVYLGLITGFLALLTAFPGLSHGAAANVTAGVAIGPQQTVPATVAYQAARPAGTEDEFVPAAPTVAGTVAIAPMPIPTPVP